MDVAIWDSNAWVIVQLTVAHTYLASWTATIIASGSIGSSFCTGISLKVLN